MNNAYPHTSPLVSCILPFSNPHRLNLVRKAVNNFIYQRYTPYELLIVNGTNQNVLTNSDMEAELYASAGCRVQEIQANPGLNAASMRNIALREYAVGNYVICIDDDDYFGPDRLLFQMAARQSGKACLLRYQLRVDLTDVLSGLSYGQEVSVSGVPKLHLLGKKEGIDSTALFPRLDASGMPWLFDETLDTGEHTELLSRIRQQVGYSVFDNQHTPFNKTSSLPLLSVAMYHGVNELSYHQFFEHPDIKPTYGITQSDIEFLKTIFRTYNFQVN